MRVCTCVNWGYSCFWIVSTFHIVEVLSTLRVIGFIVPINISAALRIERSVKRCRTSLRFL